MPVTEGDRHRADTKITETMGAEVADLLMELLPLQPATELVTRGDLMAATTRLQGEMAELRAELRGEMAQLKVELRGEMAELRDELSELRAEVRGAITNLRGEITDVRGEITEVRGEITNLRGEMSEFRAELVGLRSGVKGQLALQTAELRNEISRIYRWGAGVVAANAVAVIAALLT
jgi:predicted  nucleic acid-binding Zn-ribbon protein